MCPYYKNKEVFDSFNEMVEAFGGKPLTEEEFRSSELRRLRAGQDLLAMEHAYRCYHLNNGNFLDKAPNGEDSILFLSLLDRWNGDRRTALREKGKVYSDNFLNWFGDWTGSHKKDLISRNDGVVVYLGYDNLDDREYNYYTLDEKEASDYGKHVRKRKLDISNFLNYYTDPKSNDIKREFREQTGKIFDILDNSKEGLSVQKLFFDFVKSKGYSGISFIANENQEDNRYLVSFDNNSNIIEDVNDAEIQAIKEFCNRLGFNITKQEDAEVFIDFASKVVTLSNFDSREFKELLAKVATILMPASLHEEIKKVGEKYGKYSDQDIERDILKVLDGKKSQINEDKNLLQKILNFISDIINKIIKNLEYYEHLINEAAKEISNKNSLWYRLVIQEGFEQKGLSIEKLKASPLYYVYESLTGLGAALDGSAAIRTLGTLYRKGEEDFHDLDFSKPYDDFSWDVYEELLEFFNNYKLATNNFLNKDKIVYKDLRQNMLDNCTEHLKRSPIYKELSKHYSEIRVKHAAKTKQLGLFVTLEVDGNPVDIFYYKTIKTHIIHGIKVVDFSTPFAAKLVMRRDKDIRDIINFHKFNSGNSVSDSGNSVSKAVDKNGEPLVLWHGTENIFDVFEVDETGKRGAHRVHDRHSFFFTDTKEKAFKYRRAETMPVYLKMDNPGESSVLDGKFNTLSEYTERENEIIRDPQYDSAIFVRYDKEGDRRGMVPTKQWVVKDPNLIKSIDNFGTFSKNSDNIYQNITIESMRDYLNSMLQHPKNKWNVKDLIARANRYYGKLMFHLYRNPKTHKFEISTDQHIDEGLPDEIQRTYSRNENAIKEICEFLKSKFPDAKLTYGFYDEKLWHDFGFPPASNSFIRGNRVYLRKDRVTTEIAAEEFLHTLVYNLKYDNPALYNNLLQYARRNFKKLNEEINLAYAKHENRDEELVTLVLARYFNDKFDQSINVEKSKRNTLDSLLNRFKNWLVKLFKTAPVFSQYLQKYEITADNINPLIGFEDIADLLLTEDTAFVVNSIPKQQMRLSVSAQDRLDAANKSVIEQYKLLYKHFDSVAKLSNKPEDSVRHENLFRTISELRQRASDEALLYFVKQALDDIGEVGTTNPKTILYKLEKSYKLPDPFSDMTPQDIMNQKRYVIGFYQNVLKQIPRYDSDIFKNNPIFSSFVDDLKKLTESVDRAYYLWTQAVRISGDRIIDKIVDEDVTMADEQKENMKVVAKDWLHRNLFYGDISERLSQLVLSSGNNNLVVRMAMNLIGYAELRRAEDSQHANNLLDRQRRRCLKNIKRAATPGNWETVFMEIDDNGVPTGNFSRPANYGLYEKDKNQFLKDLCERWERDYGFYYTEIDGDYVNSATGGRGVDENWTKDPTTGKWIEPMYVKWLREIEMFDGDRIHRRYTHEYYMEQLTRPFTGSIEDLNNIAAPAAHGLSPKTRHKYNYYIENINYYLLKCIDRSTGIPHPERLSPTDRKKLKMWQDAKKDLENPYTSTGAPKVDEEFTMALEIAAWNKWVSSKTNSSLDYGLYEKELLSVQNEANRTGNLQIVSDFINFNTELKIHPDYLPKFFKRWGNSNWMKYTAVLDQILRLIKIPNYPWSVDLSIVKDNIFFLIDAKNADTALNANINKPDYVDGKPDKDTLKALAEEYDDKISEHLAPYIDPNGKMWTKSGQPYNPSIHNLNDLLTWFDYLLEHFTNVAINSGTIPGIVDRLGNPVPCRSMTKLQIRDILEFLIFRVNKTFWLNGARVIRQVPLSIFNVKLPRHSDFIAGDGKRHKTIELVPDSSYFAKEGSIIDSEYNPFDQESFVPDMNFDSGRYDNRKNFNKIKSDPELNRMYNMMIASMKHSWELIGFQRGRFNYKLPLIEASYDSILSRIGKYGVSKVADMAWRKLSNVQQRDENMRTNEQLIKMPDGTEAEDVPKRYIDPLDDPALITSNVVGSVALFRDAAYNYAYKQGVQSAIEILTQNMNTQFRQESTPENPEYVDSKGAELFSTAENSEAAMKYILETQVYGNKTEAGFGEHRDNKLYTAAMHVVGWSLRMETVVMLGLNLISIGVGLGSSTIRLIKEAFMGRYLTPWDFGRGLAKTLYDLPMIVGNFGNSLINNKTGALMLIFGVSKNQYATYINMANGRISKFLGNMLMGGYSMLDWWANAVVLSSYMHNVRFYDGDEIPKGFYSGYQMKAAFKSAGYSKAYANREYMKCTTTLYGVYKYKDGTCIIDSRYKEYVTPKIKKEIYTKTHKRIALYNGVTPDNDEIRVKKSILGRFIFALRGFLLTQAHHLGGGLTANGYDDTTVYDVGIKNDRTIRGGKVKSKQVLYKSKRTAADNEHRMGWDFETGTPLDDIYHNLIRATVTSFRKIAHAASAGKVESRKFSLAERYAAIDALIYLLIMIAMMIAWPTIHDWAQDLIKYPTGPETAGLEESFGNYGLNYIDNGIYAAQVDAIMMRLNVEQLTNIDISTVGELITAVTSLQSGYKDTFGGPLTLTSDALGLSGHNPTEMCRKGTAYTYETRLTRGLYKTFGAPDNLHASFTSRHLAANQKWYFNQYGKLYEWFGYKPEWKWSTLTEEKKSSGKKKSSKKNKNSSSFHQPLRSSGGFHKSLRD